MNLLTLKDFTKSYTDKILFDQAQFHINEGDKIGIIGINGTGKSTLLKILAGLEETEIGEIAKGNKVFLKYLPQNPVFKEGVTIYDYVIKENEASDSHWDIEGEAKMILNKLGFEDISLKVANLSGGQKKKVALAGALLTKCDILLLDEPTNHLDNDMTEWLQDYLQAYRGAIVMVTHDRYFLDLVCNRIVEIEKGKTYSYDENYEGYLERKAQRVESDYATARKHASILRKEREWMMRGARARSTKQKAHIARFEALNNEEKIKEDDKLEINALSSRLGKKTVELHNLSFGYQDTLLFSDFTYIFLKTDRIGIIGPNGCGKSTLLKLITGKLQPIAGNIEIGETVKIGYFAQENQALEDNMRVIDYIRETAEYIQTSEGGISASQMLERFLFDATLQYSFIGKLSGGEKRRLYLLKVLMEAPNVLILDEPTNDLDIQTLQILEDYLDEFPGILICVSHDRYFLDRVTTRLLAFEEWRIRQFEGTYTQYYLEWKEKLEEKSKATSDIETKEKTQKVKTEKLKFTFQEKKDYDSLPDEMEKIEQKLKDLEEEMLKMSRDFVKLNELMKEKEDTEILLEEKMERYFYLEDLSERINQQ